MCYSTTLRNVNIEYSCSTDVLEGGLYNWRPCGSISMTEIQIRTIYHGYSSTNYDLPHNY